MFNYYIWGEDAFPDVKIVTSTSYPELPNKSIPEGYELVELENHKKQRLEKERESLTARKKMLLGLLDEVDAKFKEIKKELG